MDFKLDVAQNKFNKTNDDLIYNYIKDALQI